MTEPHTTGDLEYPELPNGWSWWSGETSQSYYTRWFGTDYDRGGAFAGKHGLGGYDGQIYWDKGQPHTVEIRPITGHDGPDPVFGYPVVNRQFDSMEEAVNAVPELIEELRE